MDTHNNFNSHNDRCDDAEGFADLCRACYSSFKAYAVKHGEGAYYDAYEADRGGWDPEPEPERKPKRHLRIVK